jgi:hypothetical protein
LRGLRQILAHLARGGDFETLLVGRISASHISIVQELQFRGVLRDPPLRPRYAESLAAKQRLAALGSGNTNVLDLVQ